MEQNQPEDEGSTGTLELCTLPVQTSLVSQSPISGRLDRQTYVAACTRGDGACGLHALFGSCRGGELFAKGVRRRLMNHMPSDLGQFLLATDDAHKMIIYDCLDQIWHDAMKAASILQEGSMLQDEFSILWKCLSADQQKQIEELAAANGAFT